MYKRHNIFEIARLYLKSYFDFLENTDVSDSREAYNLFMYSIKAIYGTSICEYNKAIEGYGDKCINHLMNTPYTPKNTHNVGYVDRVNMVSVCEGYALKVFK